MPTATAPLLKPDVPVDSIKSFGPFGPLYKVGNPIRAMTDGDWLVTVEVIETGERLEYRLSHIHDDPDAA